MGEAVKQFLQEICPQRFYVFIEPWQQNATRREINGLYVFSRVYKSRGMANIEHRRLGVRRKTEGFRHSSTGHVQEPARIVAEVHSVLTEKAQTALTNWLTLNPSKNDISLVLSFLRGFLSVTQVTSLGKRRPRPLSHASPELQFPQVRDFDTAFGLGSPQERKQLTFRGNKELGDWVSFVNSPRATRYQETFYSPAKRHEVTHLPDFRTSLISTLMPEPRMNYTLLK